MPIRKRSINDAKGYTDYIHLKSNYNDSNISNYSHYSNLPTNFNLKEITLEDCDRAVFEEFNKRFKVGEKWIGLILLDAELTSIHMQNFEQFDLDKGYLNGPFFTIFRNKTLPKYRTNPSYKPVVYVVPKTKPQGIVYEEWITEGPLSYDLIYELKFITNRRDFTNEMEAQMRHYFRNKRNMIVVNNERFVIGPEDQNTLSDLEIVNREDIAQKTLYVSTFTLKFDCFTRSLANMQKRERPNRWTLDISIKDSVGTEETTYTIDRFETKNEPYPEHPSPNPSS